jgi:hypothetical protein
MEILALLTLLQIKHWYADFKIQTYVQTVRKGIYRDPIGISHSLDHTWATMVALLVFSFFHLISVSTIIVISIAEGLAHYHIDYVKVKYGCKDNTKPLFWNQFGLDQLAHQLTYIGMIYFILAL